MRPILNCLAPAGKRASLTALLLLLLLPAAVGCFAPRAAGGPPTPLPGGPEYSALMVSSDLAAGDNRVAFALVDRDNRPVAADTARVRAVYTAPGAARGTERAAAVAQFLPWPPAGSGRGVFITDLTFDQAGAATAEHPGLWELEISADSGGQVIQATTAVRVAAEPSTPAIGAPAPRSVTPTAGPKVDLSTISSAPDPDPELYQLSVHQALDADLPLVLLFSTPAFCVSATCGPQLEILSALKERYRGQANFIHIEVFADPHLIQGNRLTARQVPAVAEWGLPTEPWTFVVDKEGRIAAKFEQFTPAAVLAAALEAVL